MEVCPGEEQAGKQAMKQVLGIRDEKTHMKVTPPLAVASIAQERMTCDGAAHPRLT